MLSTHKFAPDRLAARVRSRIARGERSICINDSARARAQYPEIAFATRDLDVHTFEVRGCLAVRDLPQWHCDRLRELRFTDSTVSPFAVPTAVVRAADIEAAATTAAATACLAAQFPNLESFALERNIRRGTRVRSPTITTWD